MIDLVGSYTRETRRALHFFGAWPPGTSIELGTYGTLEDSWFRPQGKIQEKFQINVVARPASPKLQFEFMSAGVSQTSSDVIMSATPASLLTSGSLKTKVGFRNSGSVYFRTKDTTYHTISNLNEVSNAIMERFEARDWDGHLAFVHGYYSAAGTTIIISGADGAELELEGAATSGAINLADASVNLAVKSKRDIAFQVIAKQDLIPLMCLSQIQPRNKCLALLGWSEETLQPLISGDEGASVPTSDTILTQLTPEVSIDLAAAIGCGPGDLFHVVEL